MELIEVRCKSCDKLLGRFEGKGEVKCPRVNCGGKNIFDTEKGTVKFTPKQNHVAMKDRTSSSGFTFH